LAQITAANIPPHAAGSCHQLRSHRDPTTVGINTREGSVTGERWSTRFNQNVDLNYSPYGFTGTCSTQQPVVLL